MRAYDPLVETWDELPEIPMFTDAKAALAGADMVVVCLPDGQYRGFLADALKDALAPGAIVIDPWDMVADDVGNEFHERGIALEVFGRGDVKPQA